MELFCSAFSRIWTEYGAECRKMRTRATPNTNTFQADIVLEDLFQFTKTNSTPFQQGDNLTRYGELKRVQVSNNNVNFISIIKALS